MISEPFRCLPPFFRLVRVTQNGRPQIYQLLPKTGLFVEEKMLIIITGPCQKKSCYCWGRRKSHRTCTALHCKKGKEKYSTPYESRNCAFWTPRKPFSLVLILDRSGVCYYCCCCCCRCRCPFFSFFNNRIPSSAVSAH
jgi:hypothetical protein